MDAMSGGDIEWDGDLPRSRRFGDPFFSAAGGLAEARHVFLRGNGLPERLQPGFAVLELGFGTGLNALATLRAFREAGAPGPVSFTSFEAYPLSPEDGARARAAFPEIAAEAQDLQAAMVHPGPWDLDGFHLAVVEGLAADTVPAWEGAADAVFLDGFAPSRNPGMWEPALMAAVAARMRPGGTLATYSVAGAVRRALAAAGLEVERRPGFGQKRHMTVARKAGP